MRPVRQVAFALVIVAACSSNSIGPAGAGHPTGTIESTQPLTGRPFGAAISSNGLVLVGRQDEDSVSPATVSSFQFAQAVSVGHDPGDVAFAPDGATAYVANFNDATVGVIDVATQTQVATIPVVSSPYVVRVSPDGATLYVSTASSGLQRYRTSDRTSIGTVITNSQGNGLAFSPDGSLIYQSSLAGQTVQSVNTSTGMVARTYTVGPKPQGVAVSPTGRVLWVADESLGVQAYDVASGSLIGTVDGTAGAFGLELTPDGAQLYATSPSIGWIKIIDRRSHSVVESLGGGVPRRLAFSKDGRHAVVADEALGAILIK